MTALTEKTEAARTVAADQSTLLAVDIILLIAVLATAIFFRVWQWGQVPPGMDFDEAFESFEALRLLTQPGYHPVFFAGNWGVPPLKIYLTALAFLLGGEHMWAIRAVSAVLGVVTVLALYVLTRSLFPLPVQPDDSTNDPGASHLARTIMPAIAGLILAVLPWHVAFSRRGVEVILLPLWAILAVLFLVRGLKSGKYWQFALSGFFWGSAIYTYQAAWLLPGVLALFLAYKTIQERGFWRRHGTRLLLLMAVALLVALPLAVFALQNPAVFGQRASQTNVAALAGDAGQATLAGNAAKLVGLFVTGGDPNASDGLSDRSPIPWPLALALAGGLLVSLRRIKRAEYGLLLIWFFWMLTPSLITNDAPSIRRAIGSTPAMAMLMALGICWAVDKFEQAARGRSSRRLTGPLALVAVAALLIFTTGWSYQYYFRDWGRGKDLFHWFDVGLVQMGQAAAQAQDGTALYYTPAPDRSVLHLPLAWQVRDRELRTFDGQSGLVLAAANPAGVRYLVKTFQGDSSTLPALQNYYPTGQLVDEVSNEYGVPYGAAFTVPRDTAPTLTIQYPLAASFDDEVTLLGANLSATEIRAGEPLTVTLFWQSASGPLPQSYTIFAHLLGPPNPTDGGPLCAGQDGLPLDGSYSTTRWNSDEIVVNEHVIVVPGDALPGDYQVEVGLYLLATGERLAIVDDQGQRLGDSLVVTSIPLR